jgi:hypothetical protein
VKVLFPSGDYVADVANSVYMDRKILKYDSTDAAKNSRLLDFNDSKAHIQIT